MGPPGGGGGGKGQQHAQAAQAAADWALHFYGPAPPGQAPGGPQHRAGSRAPGRAAPGRAGGGRWQTGPSVTDAKVFCPQCDNWVNFNRLPKINWVCQVCFRPGLGVNPETGISYSAAEAWALQERRRLAQGENTPHVQGWGRRYDTGPARGRSSGPGRPPQSAADPFGVAAGHHPDFAAGPRHFPPPTTNDPALVQLHLRNVGTMGGPTAGYHGPPVDPWAGRRHAAPHEVGKGQGGGTPNLVTPALYKPGLANKH